MRERSRYEAFIAPDGRVERFLEAEAEGSCRMLAVDSTETLGILADGRDILYRFDEGRSVRNVSYPDLLEAMRQEARLTLFKARHGELLDEPELVPALRSLLKSLEATAVAFQEAWENRQTRP
jgi:hypothetical protein